MDRKTQSSGSREGVSPRRSSPKTLSRAALRRGVLALHLWLGLSVGLYFSILGMSGGGLVFGDVLERRQMPEINGVHSPALSAERLPLSAILARVRAEFPRASDDDLANVAFPDRPQGAYRFYVSPPDRSGVDVLLVDPYTGRTLRSIPFRRTWRGFLYQLHTSLLAGGLGFTLNGYGALFASALLASGLWLWWPANARQFRARRIVTFRSGGRRAVRDFHQALGFYACALLLTISLTGATFVFDAPLGRAIYALTGTAIDPDPPTVAPPPNERRLPIETLVGIAERTPPRAPLISMIDPADPKAPFSCYKQLSATGFLPYVKTFLDPFTGKVLRVDDERAAPVAARAVNGISALHFGWWGGAFTKALYFLAGLTPLGLYLSGIMIFLRRRADRKRRRVHVQPNRSKKDAVGTVLPIEE